MAALSSLKKSELLGLLPYSTKQERAEIASHLEALSGFRLRSSFLNWTLTKRYIRDKRTGTIRPFTLTEYPWLERLYEIIDELSFEGRVVVRKAAQIGATEWAINLAFYILDGQGSVFYALPPGPTAGDFAHARIDPAIGGSPYIRDEMAGNIDNVGLKVFRGGYNLYIRSTSVPKGDPSRAAQLSEVPADVAILDEFDRIPPAARPLIRDRLGDSRVKWEIDLSTPTYPDLGVDAEYHQTKQYEPQIKCQACGEWRWLEWGLVRGPTADDPHARLVCVHCGETIKRYRMWEDGRARWQARYPEREIVGFWVPKLVSDRASLDVMWENSQKRRDEDRLSFWNSDMGLPYEPKGARLTRTMIAACAAAPPVYRTFPDKARWTAMGVDVGYDLHYWIKKKTADGRERAVAIGSVLNWRDLDRLMVRYGVRICVVDDNPELRKDREFQKRFPGRVWLAQYIDNSDAEMIRWQRRKGVVKIERTKALDEASARVELQIDELPADWENVPDIVEHLTANIKAKRIKDDGTTVYYFPKSGKPDHLHHAKMFSEVALSILPPDPARDGAPSEEVPSFDADSGYVVPGRGSLRGQL